MENDREWLARRLIEIRGLREELDREEAEAKRALYSILGEGGSMDCDGSTITTYTRTTREYDTPVLAELYPALYGRLLAKPKPRIDSKKFDACVEDGSIDMDKIIETGALTLKTSAPTTRIEVGR